MARPFSWVTESAQPRVLAVGGVLLAGLSIWLSRLGRDLVTPEAPHGIVSFELAGSLERAAAILGSWSPRAQATALLIQGIDCLYLLVYPAWLSLAAARLGARLGGRWQRSGGTLAWMVLGAAPLDAVENHALIQQLLHGPSARCAQLASGCAVAKFALVAVAVAFLAAAGCGWLLARPRAA